MQNPPYCPEHGDNTYYFTNVIFQFFFVSAIAEVNKNQGNEEYRKRDFINAIHFYTEGIKVNCKDEELNAQLYSNRAIANFKLGKNSLCFIRFSFYIYLIFAVYLKQMLLI